MLWENLKKRARKLERDLESKLQEYSKFDSNSSLTFGDAENQSSGSRGSETRTASETSELLEKLQATVTQMASCTEQCKKVSNMALLRRYKDILRDNRTFFNRTQTSIRRKQESNSLFKNAHLSDEDRMRGETDELLRERGAINKSSRMTGDIIYNAMEARNEIFAQRRIFTAASSKLVEIGSVFPGAKKLIHRIKNKKTRDNTIIAILIGLLLCFTLLWSVLS